MQQCVINWVANYDDDDEHRWNVEFFYVIYGNVTRKRAIK